MTNRRTTLRNLGKFSLAFMAAAIVVACLGVKAPSAQAQNFPGTTKAYTSNFSVPYWGPLLTCTGNYTGNPSDKKCTSACDALVQAEAILYFAMTLVLFVGVPIMFLAGGFMIIFGGASAEMVSKGRKVLLNTVIGVVLVLAAHAIVTSFLWLVQPSGSARVRWPQISCNPATAPGGELDFSTSTRATSSPVSSGGPPPGGGSPPSTPTPSSTPPTSTPSSTTTSTSSTPPARTICGGRECPANRSVCVYVPGSSGQCFPASSACSPSCGPGCGCVSSPSSGRSKCMPTGAGNTCEAPDW